MGTRARDAQSRTTKSERRPLLAAKSRARAPIADVAELTGELLAVASASETTDAPEWIEVLRLGTHGGRDGRGPYTVGDPAKIITATKARGIDPVIDYDHSTDYASPQGRPCPAAGWMKDFAVRDGAIWARVEWTPAGIAALAAKEWKYFSPVFYHTQDKGEVTCILRGALTNSPNLELRAVASMEGGAQTIAGMAKKFGEALPDFTADQLLQLMEYACRLSDAPEDPESVETTVVTETYSTTGGDADTEDEEMKITDEMVAKCAAKIKKGDAPTAEEIATARQILETAAELKPAKVEDKPAEKKVDEPVKTDAPAPVVTAAAIVTAPSEADKQVIALQTEVNNMKTERGLEKATAAVEQAIGDRKITPERREWAIGFATKHPVDFADFVKNQVPVLAAAAPVAKVTTTGGVALSKTSAAVCHQLGLDPKVFVAGYEADKADPRSAASMIARHSAL